MSFSKPYQKSGSKTVHRASRKAKFSATVGFFNPKRYRESKVSDDESRPAQREAEQGGEV